MTFSFLAFRYFFACILLLLIKPRKADRGSVTSHMHECGHRDYEYSGIAIFILVIRSGNGRGFNPACSSPLRGRRVLNLILIELNV